MAIAKDADQAEAKAIESGAAPIATGMADEIIAGVLADESEGGQWQETDATEEEFASTILDEVNRRKLLMGNAYPFEIREGGLKYLGSQTGVYEFCLATSLKGTYSGRNWKHLQINFELISCALVMKSLATGAEGLRTGWPSHDPVARPVRFKALSELISGRSGEWEWSPRAPNPDDPHPRLVKDEGVDFAVWGSFGDGRAGQLWVLGQCACGEDWDSKLHELDHVRLERWLRPPTWAQFQRAFSTPRHIPGWYVFAEVATRAGVPFDRARLAIIAEADSNFEDIRARFRDLLTESTKKVIPNFSMPEAA